MWMYYKELKRDVFVSRVADNEGSVLVGDAAVIYFHPLNKLWMWEKLNAFAPPKEH